MPPEPSIRPVDPVAVIARQVKELRTDKGWTAAQLGDALTEHGVKWDRFTVASLENGKRQNVTVKELLALAFVLDVPPDLLLFLPDRVGEDRNALQVTPTVVTSMWRALSWISGESEDAMPGTSGDGTVPLARRRAWRVATRPIRLYRAWRMFFEAAARAEDKTGLVFERAVEELARTLNEMVANGINPPPTPDDWVDLMKAKGWLERPDEVPVQPKWE
jgi:transcriptional regulator with XRE-family HTH domain